MGKKHGHDDMKTAGQSCAPKSSIWVFTDCTICRFLGKPYHRFLPSSTQGETTFTRNSGCIWLRWPSGTLFCNCFLKHLYYLNISHLRGLYAVYCLWDLIDFKMQINMIGSRWFVIHLLLTLCLDSTRLYLMLCYLPGINVTVG